MISNVLKKQQHIFVATACQKSWQRSSFIRQIKHQNNLHIKLSKICTVWSNVFLISNNSLKNVIINKLKQWPVSHLSHYSQSCKISNTIRRMWNVFTKHPSDWSFSSEHDMPDISRESEYILHMPAPHHTTPREHYRNSTAVTDCSPSHEDSTCWSNTNREKHQRTSKTNHWRPLF